MSFNFPDLVVSDSKKFKYCIDYSKIKTTTEGLYSTLMPVHAAQEINTLKNTVLKNLNESPRILDVTGNIGCGIMTVATYFPDVKATVLEINTDTYDVLCSNIDALELMNITPLNIDCYKYIQDHKSEVQFTYVYCDPPWSSIEKYNRYEIYDDLFIINNETYISVFKLIKLIFEKQLTNVVILKTPSKFDTRSKFGQQLKYIPIYNIKRKIDYRLYFITPQIMELYK
jgi:16S rRNA G966 N2-methylase RsmD